MIDIDEIEQRVSKLERHLDMSGIHNKCDRCEKLTGILFKVCGTFSREKRYCFKCVLDIYLIDLQYWILRKLLPPRRIIALFKRFVPNSKMR